MLKFAKIFGALFLILVAGIVFGARAQDDPAAAAIEFFNAGQDAHERGDIRKAIELYGAALKQLPEFPEAEYQLGTAFLALEQRSEAEDAFRRAIKLREDWTLPMAALGSLLVQRAEFAEAETLLLKAVELDPQNSPAFTALADLRLRTRARPEVLSDLLTKIRILTGKAKPTSGILIAQASIERALNDIAGAKLSVERALSIEPNSRTALAERAEIALVANDAKSAVVDAQSLVRSSPSAANKFLLARALAAGGSVEEALKLIDSIPERTKEVEAFRQILVDAASVDPASLEKQLAADPKNVVVLGRLCSLLRTSDPQKALDYCRRAYDEDPKNIDYVIGFGAALVQAKQYENAITVLDKVLRVAPDNFTARANLAVALFQLKRFAEAKTAYRWLADRRPDLAIAHYFLGIIHDQLQEYMDAMANYQRFLKLADPEAQRLEIDKVNLRLPILQKQIKKKV
ncbi:MAG: tetratricopeptide repeat protein [Acidobacteria bacterium]|nr:tetratricopeptide repeat protein [Acidobacteriota bacterium]